MTGVLSTPEDRIQVTHAAVLPNLRAQDPATVDLTAPGVWLHYDVDHGGGHVTQRRVYLLWATSVSSKIDALMPKLHVPGLPAPVYPVVLPTDGTQAYVFGALWQLLVRDAWCGHVPDLGDALLERDVTAWHLSKTAQGNGKRGGATETRMRLEPAGETTLRPWLKGFVDALLVPVIHTDAGCGVATSVPDYGAHRAQRRRYAATLRRRAERVGTALRKGGYVDLAQRGLAHRWAAERPDLTAKAEAYIVEVDLRRSAQDRTDAAVGVRLARRLGRDTPYSASEVCTVFKAPLRDAGLPVCSGGGNWVCDTDAVVIAEQARLRRRADGVDQGCVRDRTAMRWWWQPDPYMQRARLHAALTPLPTQSTGVLARHWSAQTSVAPDVQATLERCVADARDWMQGHIRAYAATINAREKRALTPDEQALRTEYDLAKALVARERVTPAMRNTEYTWAQGL